MSAPTGIVVSPELSTAFTAALASQEIRFLKIAIRNESLILDESHTSAGTLEEDLEKLQDILADDVPAYVLVRLDQPPEAWLAVYYVPDTAKVRDKMLYAATRTTLTKSLGAAHFADSLFATSKEDLTAAEYARHKVAQTAPQPLSAREQEAADVRAAEREAGEGAYEGTGTGKNLWFGMGLGLGWEENVVNAVKALNEDEEKSQVVIITVDTSSERLILSSTSECTVDELSAALPTSEPSYAFFSWVQPTRRDIVFIYSCPSSSPVKHRMVYASGSNTTFTAAKLLFTPSESSSSTPLELRRIETSDPNEITEAYLREALGLDAGSNVDRDGSGNPVAGGIPAEKKPFARPKGPGRKR